MDFKKEFKNLRISYHFLANLKGKQLNPVSSQWAHGKSSPAWKPEVHPNSVFNGKNVTLLILNFILIS